MAAEQQESFFKTGDVVRLLGSDVNMTVYFVSRDDIYVVWFDTHNIIQRDILKAALLCKRRTS